MQQIFLNDVLDCTPLDRTLSCSICEFYHACLPLIDTYLPNSAAYNGALVSVFNLTVKDGAHVANTFTSISIKALFRNILQYKLKKSNHFCDEPLLPRNI